MIFLLFYYIFFQNILWVVENSFLWKTSCFILSKAFHSWQKLAVLQPFDQSTATSPIRLLIRYLLCRIADFWDHQRLLWNISALHQMCINILYKRFILISKAMHHEYLKDLVNFDLRRVNNSYYIYLEIKVSIGSCSLWEISLVFSHLSALAILVNDCIILV